jgi:hypothetical protein
VLFRSEKEKRERKNKQPLPTSPLKIKYILSHTKGNEFITGGLKDTGITVASKITPLTNVSPYQHTLAIICS